ncbi:DUF6893 family small protein [Nocardia sp. bgisy134]
METVGVIAVVILAAIAAVFALIGLRSIPDIRRYLKIRHM